MRGTSPTLTFTTPYAADMVLRGWITFTQRKSTILDIPFEDESVTVGDQFISVDLTQEQTLSFDACLPCSVQIRAVLVGEKATKSNIVEIALSDVLKDGVI